MRQGDWQGSAELWELGRLTAWCWLSGRCRIWDHGFEVQRHPLCVRNLGKLVVCWVAICIKQVTVAKSSFKITVALAC